MKKFNCHKAVGHIDDFVHSCLFPFIIVPVAVFAMLLDIDVVLVWYVGIVGSVILLCCKEISPLVCLLLFVQLFSMKSIALTVIPLAILVISAILRIIHTLKIRAFKITPLFIGLCAYCLALILNGIFSNNYTGYNILYSVALGAIMVTTFVCISSNIELNEGTFRQIAFGFIALCITLACQLLIIYTTKNVIKDGKIYRHLIFFIWGTYNQFGMLISLCLPVWFYLATKYKYGYLFLFGAAFNIFVSLMCMSRQAILVSAILAVACFVWYLSVVPVKQKLIGCGIVAAIAIITLVFYLTNKDFFAYSFGGLLSNFNTGSGRTRIWKEAIKKFFDYPLFGNGFYDLTATNSQSPGYLGNNNPFEAVIPFMGHNTGVQLLFSCGVVGLIVYVIHRGQTLLSLINNPSKERFLVMFAILAITLTSLLDNHMFYPLPLIIYATLLALLSKSEKKEG